MKKRRHNSAKITSVPGAVEIEKPFLTQVKELMNLGHVKKTIHVGTELFGAISPFLDKPDWWNGCKAAFAVGKVLIDEVEIWSDDYFSGEEWSMPYSRDFNQTILSAIAGYPFQIVRTSDENSMIKLVDLEGIKIGYTINTRSSSVDNIYVETSKLNAARDHIKKLLWDSLKDANIVMRQNKRTLLQEEESRVIFEPDDAFHPLKSARATDYSTYLKRCIDANVSRSVMLYGPPGTGKSTMARTIVDTLGMRSFRIRVEDVAGIESSTLFEAVSIFEPDAIILDDFDRAHAQAQLLETLEFFQRHVKIVIATVNDRNSLDEAILRPGRFDELVFVKQMDEDVVKHVLGPALEDAFDIVKDWPIAFIQEYAKRRRFMSAEEAAISTAELADRVKRLQKYDDVSDVERMLAAKKRLGIVTEDIDDAVFPEENGEVDDESGPFLEEN